MKMQTRTRIVLGFALAGLIGIVPIVGMLIVEERERLITEDDAVWMARMWAPESSLEQVCRDASERAGRRIDPDQWTFGTGDTLLVGPAIKGERIRVRRDRSISWGPSGIAKQNKKAQQTVGGNGGQAP